MEINSFPPEIISHIFSFCGIRDKRNIRLTCTLWYSLCNVPSLINQEKLLFRMFHDPIEIDKYLKNCEHIRPYFEFQGLDFHEFPIRSWSFCGLKITSLIFHCCRLYPSVIYNVAIHCSNVKYLEMSLGPLQEFPLESLDRLLHENKTQTALTEFRLNADYRLLFGDRNYLQTIFKVFPSIKKFHYINYGFETYKSSVPPTIGFKLLSTVNPTVSTFFSTMSGWFLPLASDSNLKFQEIYFRYECNETFMKSFVEALKKQTELEHLTISATRRPADDYDKWPEIFKKSVFEILSSVPKLESLNIAAEKLLLSPEEFSKFINYTSKLKTLNCSIVDVATVQSEVPAALPSSQNLKLNTLQLCAIETSEGTIINLLTHCPHLENLEIPHSTDNILQQISKNHTNLKTLLLKRTDNCTSFGFTGRREGENFDGATTYSISRLENLEYLELIGDLGNEDIENVFLELKFPKLKFLLLSLWDFKDEFSDNMLHHVIDKLPLLEFALFHEMFLNRDQFLQICKYLKHLKVLHFHSMGPDWCIEQLFHVCPTLECATDSQFNAYCFDRFKNEFHLFSFDEFRYKSHVFDEFLKYR